MWWLGTDMYSLENIEQRTLNKNGDYREEQLEPWEIGREQHDSSDSCQHNDKSCGEAESAAGLPTDVLKEGRAAADGFPQPPRTLATKDAKRALVKKPSVKHASKTPAKAKKVSKKPSGAAPAKKTAMSAKVKA